MNDAQIRHMTARFLGWQLPPDFAPDNGISFQKTGNEGTPHAYTREPSGTNLLNAEQAEAMVRYIANGADSAPAPGASESWQEAANKQPPAGKWRYVRMNQPAPEGEDFVVIAAAEYEAWRLRFKKDRDAQDAALKDAIAENVALRAELDQAAGVIADRNKELEEATLARGRLRLWLEFIHLNSNDAKEFTAEALIGNAVPEGFEV